MGCQFSVVSSQLLVFIGGEAPLVVWGDDAGMVCLGVDWTGASECAGDCCGRDSASADDGCDECSVAGDGALVECAGGVVVFQGGARDGKGCACDEDGWRRTRSADVGSECVGDESLRRGMCACGFGYGVCLVPAGGDG